MFAPSTAANAQAPQEAQACYDTSYIHESRYKRTIPGEQEVKHKEYRFRSRTWIENKREVKEIKGYDFVSGGTTRVNGQTVAGHWVTADPGTYYVIPDVIINIVWGPGGPPASVLGAGSVSLSVYGGPNVTVRYKAYAVDFSGWSDWGPWSDWTTTDPGDDTDTRDVETRTVTDSESTPAKTVYYLPGGDESDSLTDANWTTDTPSLEKWTLVDERDRATRIEVPCPPETKKVTRTFQVDTYSNPTSKLATKAQRYDNDNVLKFGEDRAHYGHSKWQIVKVTGATDWTAKQWRDAINKTTTKKGVGSVTSQSHIGTVKKGKKLTVAWEIVKGSWKDSKGGKPQVFFARGY